MKLRINSCGINDCSPQWSWTTPSQGFPDYDVWAVFRGNGIISPMISENTQYNLSDGTALLLAPNIQYIAKHDPNNPLFVINIHFDFIDENGQILFPCGILAKYISDVSFLKTLLTRAVTLFYSNQQELAASYLATALSEYAISEDLNTHTDKGGWHRIISEITSKIDTASKPPSLSELAALYGYSERYIGKMFTKLNGVTFSEYIKNARISKAKSLLRNTTIPISEIALETGFYDACHFSKNFREIVGISPFSYRNNR